VPAALLAVALGALYVGYGSGEGRVQDGVFVDGIAALFWVANWRFILDGQSYGDLFAEPSPFRHFWSLAIEEQFYVALPLVVVAVLFFVSSARAARWALAGVLGVVVIAGTEWIALLHSPGDAPLRAYYGTDTRLAEPAIGALLAVVLVGGGRLRTLATTRARRACDAAGVVALLALAFFMTRLSVQDALLYDGGLFAAAALAAVVITAATQGGAVASVLSFPPLAALGRVSYGVYLFHWPVFLWLDAEATGPSGLRLLFVRCVITLGLAIVSYAVVEQPIRLGQLGPRLAGLAWANSAIAVVSGLAVLTGTVAWPGAAPRGVEIASGLSASPPPTTAPPRATQQPSASLATQPPASHAAVAAPPAPPPGPPSAPSSARKPPDRAPAQSGAPQAVTPSRYRIAFIGDSVAQNLAGGMQRWGASRGIAVLDLTIEACPVSRGGDRRFTEGHPWPIPLECGWWDDPESDRWDELRGFAPDVIVLHDGLNELADRKLDDWPKWTRPGEPWFDAWLTGEYRSLIDAVAEQRIGLLLLNVPCADWERSVGFREIDDADGRVRALNTTVYHEIGTSATKVVDLFRYLCPNGKYTDTVDGTSNARPDGFHLSDQAAERAAERLLATPIMELADRRRTGTANP